MLECAICLNTIDDQYAMIDNIGETGHYHLECLQEWIKKSKCGIITQFPIKTYSIYNADQSIITSNLNIDTDIISLFSKLIYDNLHRIVNPHGFLINNQILSDDDEYSSTDFLLSDPKLVIYEDSDSECCCI